MRAARARARLGPRPSASPPTEDARSGESWKRPAPRPSAPCVPELRVARWANRGAEVFRRTTAIECPPAQRPAQALTFSSNGMIASWRRIGRQPLGLVRPGSDPHPDLHDQFAHEDESRRHGVGGRTRNYISLDNFRLCFIT